jgi:D-3-phosphoglycerate dehydrogenase
MNVQIYRTNASSYQESAFFQKEKEVLERIEGVSYIKSLNEVNNQDPFILLTNTHTKPEQLPKVLLDKTILIIHPNSGHDNFPVDFVKNSPFPIVLGNPIRSHAVVEYTLSTLFHHYTKIENHLHWDDHRLWNRKLLRDQKVLILGHGHIGKVLSRALEPLCREVVVYDPYQENQFQNSRLKNQYSAEMFDGVQLLILAASLNETSQHLVKADVLKRLDSECVIVNPARGGLIKEDDLIHFLQKNPKAYAYLDVYEQEPFKPGYLHDLKNINKTSHIAGVYENLNKDIISFEFHIIKEFLQYYRENKSASFTEDYKECLLATRTNDNILI